MGIISAEKILGLGGGQAKIHSVPKNGGMCGNSNLLFTFASHTKTTQVLRSKLLSVHDFKDIMKYSVDKKDRYCIFSLQEENLNSVLAPDLKSEFILQSNEGVPNMILDLSNVKFIDSSGLSSILTANRLWKSSGGSFVMTGVTQPAVKKLIEISRLETVLNIVPTVEESVDFVMMEELQRELQNDGSEEEE